MDATIIAKIYDHSDINHFKRQSLLLSPAYQCLRDPYYRLAMGMLDKTLTRVFWTEDGVSKGNKRWSHPMSAEIMAKELIRGKSPKFHREHMKILSDQLVFLKFVYGANSNYVGKMTFYTYNRYILHTGPFQTGALTSGMDEMDLTTPVVCPKILSTALSAINDLVAVVIGAMGKPGDSMPYKDKVRVSQSIREKYCRTTLSDLISKMSPTARETIKTIDEFGGTVDEYVSDWLPTAIKSINEYEGVSFNLPFIFELDVPESFKRLILRYVIKQVHGGETPDDIKTLMSNPLEQTIEVLNSRCGGVMVTLNDLPQGVMAALDRRKGGVMVTEKSVVSTCKSNDLCEKVEKCIHTTVSTINCKAVTINSPRNNADEERGGNPEQINQDDDVLYNECNDDENIGGKVQKVDVMTKAQKNRQHRELAGVKVHCVKPRKIIEKHPDQKIYESGMRSSPERKIEDVLYQPAAFFDYFWSKVPKKFPDISKPGRRSMEPDACMRVIETMINNNCRDIETLNAWIEYFLSSLSADSSKRFGIKISTMLKSWDMFSRIRPRKDNVLVTRKEGGSIIAEAFAKLMPVSQITEDKIIITLMGLGVTIVGNYIAAALGNREVAKTMIGSALNRIRRDNGIEDIQEIYSCCVYHDVGKASLKSTFLSDWKDVYLDVWTESGCVTTKGQNKSDKADVGMVNEFFIK